MPPPEPPPVSDGVYLYTGSSYSGNECKVLQDEPSITQHCGSGFNDQIKSIKMVGQWSTVLYEDDDYGGIFTVFNGSDPDLFDNAIGYSTSSIRVRRTSPSLFTLYGLGDYNGPSFDSDRTVFDLSHWDFNDDAESIVIQSGYEVILCEHANFYGICGRTSQSNPDINAIANGLRNKVSSARVCSGSCPPAPTPPTPISPTNESTKYSNENILLDWSGTGTQYYAEYWGGNLPDGHKETFGWSSGTLWNLGTIEASTEPYYWHVKAWNEYGEGDWNSQSSFFVASPPPTPPSNLTIETVSKDVLSLHWHDNSVDETGFNIYRWGYDGSSWSFIFLDSASANTTLYSDTGLNCGTTYYYEVTAYKENSESTPTEFAGGTSTPCSDPSDSSTLFVPIIAFQFQSSGNIVFNSDRDGDNEIYTMNADGYNPVRLTDNLADDTLAKWSPDGSQIAFVSDRSGNNEIYIMDADGSHVVRLTHTVADDSHPDWSPDGEKIVFHSNLDGDYDIYVMDVDTPNPLKLTDNWHRDVTAKYSPDGNKIFYQSWDSNSSTLELFSMNSDGSNITKIAHLGSSNYEPAISPDGTKIVYFSLRDDNPEIYIANIDGTNEIRLTYDPDNDYSPSFSSSGQYIIFHSDRTGNREIYRMNLDGSNLVNLTNNPSEDRWADWK